MTLRASFSSQTCRYPSTPGPSFATRVTASNCTLLACSWVWPHEILNATSASNGYNSPYSSSGWCLRWSLAWSVRDALTAAGWTPMAAITTGKTGATTAIGHRPPSKVPRHLQHRQSHSPPPAWLLARSRRGHGRSETAPKHVQQDEHLSGEASPGTGLTSTGTMMGLPVSRTRDDRPR